MINGCYSEQSKDLFDQTIHCIREWIISNNTLPTLSDLDNWSLPFATDSLSPGLVFRENGDIIKSLLYTFTKNQYTQKNVYYDDIKDLLFDQIMSYLDHIQPSKQIYEILFQTGPTNPEIACLMYAHYEKFLRHSLTFLVKPLPSWKKFLLIQSSIFILVSALKTWFNDHSFDQSTTMAKLNEDLESVNRWV